MTTAEESAFLARTARFLREYQYARREAVEEWQEIGYRVFDVVCIDQTSLEQAFALGAWYRLTLNNGHKRKRRFFYTLERHGGSLLFVILMKIDTPLGLELARREYAEKIRDISDLSSLEKKFGDYA